MTLDPGVRTAGAVPEVRAAARRQARRLSAGVALMISTTLAVLAVAAFVVLDYRFDQDPHRLVKVLIGAALIGAVLTRPRFGLLVLPVLTPFLAWLPRVPVPGLNPLNVMLLSVFFTWSLSRIVRGEPIFRPSRLGWTLGALVALTAISVVRGAAFPTGYGYRAGESIYALIRCAMTFTFYFITLAMVRGEKDRRHLAWAIALALIAESACTIAYGRNGRGARALGSFGQSNELGAFLAMFTAFTAALLPATRRLFARLLLAAGVLAGIIAALMSVSRGALVALAAGLLYVGLRSSRTFTLLLVAVLLTSPWWAPDYVRNRVLGTQVEVEEEGETELEGSAQLRVDTWKAIVTVVREHPLDGVGFTGLGYVLPETGSALGLEVKDTSHNTYLRMLGEMGILGLILFVLLLWRCGRLAADGVRAATSRFDRQVAVGLGAATLAMAISCAFGDRFFSVLITGNYWIAAALVNDALMERPEAAA